MSVTVHTTHGPLKLELYTSTPKTTYNFLALAASSAYNTTVFHRSIRGFILQGGSPDTTGRGKTSPSIYGSDYEDEIRPALRHNTRGIVSSANRGPGGTNGSQFFITYAAAPHLDGKNTVFGRVIEGAEEGGTLDKIEAVDVEGKKFRPVETIAIESIQIHANPLADE